MCLSFLFSFSTLPYCVAVPGVRSCRERYRDRYTYRPEQPSCWLVMRLLKSKHFRQPQRRLCGRLKISNFTFWFFSLDLILLYVAYKIANIFCLP